MTNTIIKTLTDLFDKIMNGDVEGMRVNASEEAKRISMLSNDELVGEFELRLRKGYGEYAVVVVWLKREIIKRMKADTL